MKAKFTFISLILFYSLLSQAQPKVTLTVASNYLWRGLSFTNGAPTIQGLIEQPLSSNFSVGFFASNLVYGEARSEADVYLAYQTHLEKINTDFGAQAFYYSYINDGKYNTGEFTLWIAKSQIRIETSYTPRYFSKNFWALYSRLSYTYAINKSDNLNLGIGYYHLSNETLNIPDNFGSWADFKLGLSRSVSTEVNLELQFTTTNRRNLVGEAYSDAAVSILASRVF